MKQLFILFYILLLSPLWAAAQNTISGTVTDGRDSRALPGATVRLSRANTYTLTSAQGNFTLAAKSFPDTLSVSFIGYQSFKQVIKAAPDSTIRIILLAANGMLKEVEISTGYQTLPKERATGSFEHIDQALLNREVSTDVISRLDGLASGVIFDKRGGAVNNYSISVRGLSTLTQGYNYPLIVLDNFPYEGDVNNINPNDVESITVLKDAAAASIWGTRAGNGVIVITTKKGHYNLPLKVSLSSNLTSAAKPNTFAIPVISSSDFIDVEKYLFNQGFYNSAYSNTYNRPVLSPVEEILQQEQNGTLSNAAASGQIDALRKVDVRNDFQKYIYRNAFSQQHNVSLSGGTNNLNYLMSVGYDKNLQSLVGNEYGRLTMKTESSYKPLKNLELQLGSQFSQSNTQLNSQGGYGSIYTGGGKNSLYPYASLADEQGNALVLEKAYRLSYADTAGQGKLLNWKYKPLEEIRLADHTVRLNDILLKASARYNFSPSFNAELRYQYEQGITRGRNYYSENTYYTRNLINQYTQVSGSTVSYPVPLGGILDQSESVLSANDVRTQLNFNHDWQDKHQLNILAGAEIRQAKTDASATRTYGYNGSTLVSLPVDMVTLYPIYGGLASDAAVPYNNVFSGLLNRNVSLFGNGSYVYDSRYMLSFSARRDASNIFGIETNRKWIPLWSAGFSWNTSNEAFYKFTAIPYLKFRSTYGYSGNVNNSISALTTIIYREVNGNSSINGLPFANIVNYPNPDLRWEKVATFNVGLDFASKNNVLSGSIDYYNKRATDLIALVPADITQGAGSYLTANSAVLNTRGMDITLNSVNLKGKLHWNTVLLFSMNKNEVVKYLYTPTSYSAYVGNGSLNSPVAGQPAYSIISYKWAGLDPETGSPRAYLNGKISEDYAAIVSSVTKQDLVFHGSAVPQFFGSVRNELSYKQFSLSANIVFRLDYYFRRATTSYDALFNNWTGFSDFALRWQKPGDETVTDVPSMVYPANSNRDAVYNYSSITVEKGDNIRLQDLRLAFGLSPKQWKGLPFKEAALFFYANNLGIIWRANKQGLDPDYVQGIPLPQTFSLGFKINF